jgi:hypothetical protein
MSLLDLRVISARMVINIFEQRKEATSRSAVARREINFTLCVI